MPASESILRGTGLTARASGARVWLAFLTCCLIWGSTFLFIRIGNSSLPPVWAATIRLALASVLLGLIARSLKRRWPRGPELRAALAFGFVDFGISLPLLYWGEREVPSGVAAVMFATIPLTTSLFAWGFRLERLRLGTLVAAVLAIGGVALLASSPLAPGITTAALSAVALAAITASLAGVLLKRAPDSDPFAMNSIAHGVGALVCLAVSAMLGERWAMPRGAEWWPVLYLTIVGSIFAFVTFAWLLQRWPASRASFIAVCTPVVATFLGARVLGERLTAGALAGAVVVIAAVLIGILGNRTQDTRR